VSELNYDLRVFENAGDMHKAITQLDSEGRHARTVAGYCWDWKSKKDRTKYDIEIDDLKMRWNLKDYGNKWILHPSSISEAGCVHTCQGLELEYIGVIVGLDLLVREGQVITDGMARSSQDKTIRGFRKMYNADSHNAQKSVELIIKNTYKTLMTRGMKGCYIHCVDKETNKYFKNQLL
jgi:DUF2075 family protein